MNAAIPALLFAALLVLGMARAQDEPQQDAAPAAEQKAPAPDRGFTPSQEVSPDQEVDFPADI